MKSFIKKWMHVLKYVKNNALTEYNKKDGYIFRTNINKKDKVLYESIADKLGMDYRIENNATDCGGSPLSGYYAFYVHKHSDSSKFLGEYLKAKEV